MGGQGVVGKVYEYSLINIIPYLSIIVFSLIGLNVFIVLGLGIGIGLVIGLVHGSFTFFEIFGILQRGLGWMEDMAMIAMVVGGGCCFNETSRWNRLYSWKLTSRIKSKKGAEFGIAALVSVLDLATTNNTVSIITAGH